jgi:hypothetical protein
MTVVQFSPKCSFNSSFSPGVEERSNSQYLIEGRKTNFNNVDTEFAGGDGKLLKPVSSLTLAGVFPGRSLRY